MSLWDSLGPDVENYILELKGGLEHREMMEEMNGEFNSIVYLIITDAVLNDAYLFCYAFWEHTLIEFSFVTYRTYIQKYNNHYGFNLLLLIYF